MVLASLERVSPRELHELAWRHGSAASCLDDLRRAGTRTDRAIIEATDPRRVAARVRALGGRLVTPADEEYPERLLDLPDPPPCLFVRGRSLLELGTAVAVVGARACSPYGRDAAIAIASDLALAGVTVVSGAALGVDGAAHQGALRAGGHTVAVLGSGLDRPHPRRNEELIEQVALEGTVATEYPPGAEPWPRRFPARNRVIAAMSHGVVVVEGASGSGSLQTAEYAGEDLGRQVMAVPGPIDSELSRAPHDLIRQGAALVTGARDVLDALELFDVVARTPDAAEPAPAREDERRVRAVLSGRPASAESIAEASGVPFARTIVALSSLELLGHVETVGGRYRGTSRRREPARPSPQDAW